MAFGDKKPQRVETASKSIEINAEMHGSLSFKEQVDLKINGHFTGSLDVRGTLTVGGRAEVEADIVGDNVVIAGKIKGNVSVAKMLTLLPTAVLIGNITAPKLNIVEGAIFQGNCQMSPAETNESMNIKELTVYLELDEGTIIELVRSGKIPVVRDGDVLKFERSQIDSWAAAGMVK
ncbi:MAG: polymer-forming cytoskeletal protein [Candidatus Omnitrophica bacterium]|nr:polymer-forming cytoskeletal protein [Candidatus Omnitrophota bacterium]